MTERFEILKNSNFDDKVINNQGNDLEQLNYDEGMPQKIKQIYNKYQKKKNWLNTTINFVNWINLFNDQMNEFVEKKITVSRFFKMDVSTRTY